MTSDRACGPGVASPMQQKSLLVADSADWRSLEDVVSKNDHIVLGINTTVSHNTCLL